MHDSTRAPAPWQLTGHGYLLALHCSRAFGEHCLRDCPEFQGRALGGVGTLMVVDYASSNVGPYRELLLSPGSFQIGERRALAITHIWVSSHDSVTNGRRNWGLPKEKAVFESQRNADGSETFRIQRNQCAPLTLTFTARGPKLPVTTRLLPERWRTLEQPWRGQRYHTVVRANGRAGLAKLSHWDNPSDSGFPDFSSQPRVFCVAVSKFNLTFPLPRISPDIS